MYRQAGSFLRSSLVKCGHVLSGLVKSGHVLSAVVKSSQV